MNWIEVAWIVMSAASLTLGVIHLGIGYSFKWGDVVAAWRYLDYDMKSDDKVQSLNFNGPAIAAVFRWRNAKLNPEFSACAG